MAEQSNAEEFAKIEEETKTYLKGDNLRIAMDLLAYLKESGRTWIMSEYHPEFYYMGELIVTAPESTHRERNQTKKNPVRFCADAV